MPWRVAQFKELFRWHDSPASPGRHVAGAAGGNPAVAGDRGRRVPAGPVAAVGLGSARVSAASRSEPDAVPRAARLACGVGRSRSRRRTSCRPSSGCSGRSGQQRVCHAAGLDRTTRRASWLAVRRIRPLRPGSACGVCTGSLRAAATGDTCRACASATNSFDSPRPACRA